MKKIMAMLSIGMALSNTTALAEGKTGELYEKREKATKYSINKEALKDEKGIFKEEFWEDRVGLNSLFELKNKTTNKYEVAIANDNGTFSFVEASESFENAKGIINNKKDNSNYCIVNEEGRVIYAKDAMGRVIKHINGEVDPTVKNITNIYDSSTMKNPYTYVNHGYIDDVPIIEDLGNKAKVEIGSYKGWLNKDSNSKDFDLVVVPLNHVVNPSHYKVKNGELLHFLSSDILNKNKSGYYITLGPAPSFLKEGQTYYSYDGEYFYNSLKTLLSDLKNNKYNNAINKNNRFYSYYLNLPFRTKTRLTSTQINSYISKNTSSTSKLIGSGQYFLKAEEKYGVNALLMLGIAINESGWGNSEIAQSKNNLFGINAIDSNPGEAAGSFESVEGCIMDFAKHYISKGYSDPDDWRYYGGILGNKEFGANVKYASDPFWGEKASRYYYNADLNAVNGNKNQLKDYNSYQLAIKTTSSKVVDSKNNTLYSISTNKSGKNEIAAVPFALKEIKTYNINNIKSYKIYPRRTTPVSTGEFKGEYDWNFDGYTPSETVKLINTKKPTEVDLSQNGWQKIDNKLYYVVNGKLQKGFKEIKNKTYYFDSKGVMQTGWKEINQKKYYFDSKGVMQTGWKEIDKKKYYFNQDGTMKLGWLKDKEKWYYIENSGVFKNGWKSIKGYKYYFNENGIMETGWLKKADKWYYLQNNGAMRISWMEIKGKWYYFDNNGVMQKGWKKHKGNWYYLQNSGAMRISWMEIEGQWYYFNSNGIMQKGWKKHKGSWYYLQNSGAMRRSWMKIENKWYYFNTDGVMQKGWKKYKNKWYYLNKDGSMAVNTKIDGYKIDSEGVSNRK